MSAEPKTPQRLSLERWSRRKLEAAREKEGAPAAAESSAAGLPAAAANRAAAEPVSPPATAAALPPVESLTLDSDFGAFLQPEVGDALKRQALKQLFRDPRFNVMDGLDVYIDDYSKPDPISPDIVRQMVQGRYVFDPPQTRINAQGHAEDVPPEALAAAAPAEIVATAPEAPLAAAGAAATAPCSPVPGEAAAGAAPTAPGSAVAGESAAATAVPADAGPPGRPAQ